jgi:hypothetical protein
MLNADSTAYKDIPQLDEPFITGLSYRQAWRNIEKVKGVYDWTSLDDAYAQTQKRGKWLMITITAGMGSPEWVYGEGVRAIYFSSDEVPWMGSKGGNKLKMVVPWDEAYLSQWDRFLAALGARINSMKHIFCIHVTGGGFISEMHLPKKLPETIRQWKEAGASDAVCLRMWQKIFASYGTHMPKHVGLAIALSPTLSNIDVSEALQGWAKETYGNRVWLQRNTLKAERGPLFFNQLKQAAEYTTVGWQTAIAPGRDFGDRTATFQNAVESNGSYVEVYDGDIRDRSSRAALVDFNNALKKTYNKFNDRYFIIKETR